MVCNAIIESISSTWANICYYPIMLPLYHLTVCHFTQYTLLLHLQHCIVAYCNMLR